MLSSTSLRLVVMVVVFGVEIEELRRKEKRGVTFMRELAGVLRSWVLACRMR